MEKIYYSDINMNNEHLLFENKININKLTNYAKPKIYFRNDALNNIINGCNNYLTENKNIENIKLTENKFNYFNKNNIYDKNVINYFNKNKKLRLPLLSERYIKMNESFNSKKIMINKMYEGTYNNDIINTDSFRKQYIDNIMRGCCSVVKMKLPKKKINNSKEFLIFYRINKNNINYRPIYLYKNKNINPKNKSYSNNYKKFNFLSSDSLKKKIFKILVNEETTTNNNIEYNKSDNNKNDDDYNYDYDFDHMTPKKILNKNNSHKQICNYFYFNNNNDYKSNIHKIEND
jgi:hypothetical protein